MAEDETSLEEILASDDATDNPDTSEIEAEGGSIPEEEITDGLAQFDEATSERKEFAAGPASSGVPEAVEEVEDEHVVNLDGVPCAEFLIDQAEHYSDEQAQLVRCQCVRQAKVRIGLKFEETYLVPQVYILPRWFAHQYRGFFVVKE